MEKVTGRLADGREIHWFDPDGTARTATPDARDLGDPAPQGVMRRDPITGEWIALAAHRQTRTFMPSAAQCPLCPSRPGALSEVPSADYRVVAFGNRFPSFTGAVVQDEVPVGELVVERPAGGRCEVLCFSSDHDGSFVDLDVAQARLVVDAWADRTAALGADTSVEFVFPFENRGVEIGVTLQHPHGQIYGYPFVPPRAARELDCARTYLAQTGENLFGAVLAREQAGERVVAGNDHWTAFVPYAARWPVEVHLYPHRQVPDIAALSDAARDAFAELYLRVLAGFDRLYGSRLPYISAWQQAPARRDRDLAWLHLELFSIRRAADKLKFLAGSESAQGAFIGDVLPEQQAARLREVIG